MCMFVCLYLRTSICMQMDRGMIHGSEISVEPASTENGYVELSAEAASNPWSQIAAGRELKGKGHFLQFV